MILDIGVHSVDDGPMGQPPVVTIHVYVGGRDRKPIEVRIPVGTVRQVALPAEPLRGFPRPPARARPRDPIDAVGPDSASGKGKVSPAGGPG